MAKELTGGIFNRRGLAEAFGVHMQTITGWEQEGMPIELRGMRGRPSLYKLSACVQWRIERELAARGASGVELSPQQERARLDQARREELELRLKTRRGELIEVEEAKLDLANVATSTKARMRRIPDAIADQMVAAAKNGPAFVKRALLMAIDEALQELSDRGEPDSDEGAVAS